MAAGYHVTVVSRSVVAGSCNAIKLAHAYTGVLRSSFLTELLFTPGGCANNGDEAPIKSFVK